MAYLDVAECTGAEIVVIDDDEHGQVDVARRPVASSSGRRAAPGCSSSCGSLELLRPATVEIGSCEWTSTGGFTLKPGARRFETWEVGFTLQLGLGRAIEYALELGLEPIWARVSTLADSLRGQLTAMPGVTAAGRPLGALCAGVAAAGRD